LKYYEIVIVANVRPLKFIVRLELELELELEQYPYQRSARIYSQLTLAFCGLRMDSLFKAALK